MNEDVHATLLAAQRGEIDIPDVDMVVGGFPCQDYSVARTLSQAEGIEGRKGVLWWDIVAFLRLKHPRYCLFENVDRLLKSPAAQRGRDFAIILSCLAEEGYSVEWRVVNSAEYGFPQRRKRVYIYAEKTSETWDLAARLGGGVMARALPIGPIGDVDSFDLEPDTLSCSERFGLGSKASPFKAAGAMQGRHVATSDAAEAYEGPRMVLGDVLVPEDQVPAEYYVPEEQLPQWAYLKGSKRLERTSRTGHTYFYSEGAEAEREGFELKLAGCRSVKAARALLPDFGGDVDALAAAEPWLFGAEAAPTGVTGLPNAGAAGGGDEAETARWREIAGLEQRRRLRPSPTGRWGQAPLSLTEGRRRSMAHARDSETCPLRP